MSETAVAVTTISGHLVIAHREDGVWWSEIPALPGCYVAGDTFEELIEFAAGSIELWTEDHES